MVCRCRNASRASASADARACSFMTGFTNSKTAEDISSLFSASFRGRLLSFFSRSISKNLLISEQTYERPPHAVGHIIESHCWRHSGQVDSGTRGTAPSRVPYHFSSSVCHPHLKHVEYSMFHGFEDIRTMTLQERPTAKLFDSYRTLSVNPIR